MTTEELRLEYLKIREWGICDQRNLTAARFDAVVLEKLGTADADPAQWVAAAAALRIRCDPCGGSGDYAVGVENGKRLIRGICFRCEGRGVQTHADRLRNDAYDRLNFNSR